MTTEHGLSTILTDTDYLEERTNPRAGDLSYFHLADVLRFLQFVLPKTAVDVIDFGSGGAPYRGLLKPLRYRTADVEGSSDPDLLIENGRLPCADNDCDLVLSTQVLEHVESVPLYLAEARRVLRPGGKLVLTTHGSFPDHACPGDYWRWTTEGLATDLRRAGFEIERMDRLTVGLRCLAQLAVLHAAFSQGSRAFGWRASRAVLLRSMRLWEPLIASLTQANAVRHDAVEGEIYMGLGIVASSAPQ